MRDRLRPEIDEALVRLADGDRDAFDPLFTRLRPLLERFAGRFLPEPQDAEDAAQNALLKVFSRVSQFDPQRDALSWIFGIAANECRTLRHQRQRRREEPMQPEAWAERIDPQDGPEERQLEAELLEGAALALGTLSPQDQETIRIAIHSDAKPSGIGAATFRKRLERALRRLRLVWGTNDGRL